MPPDQNQNPIQPPADPGATPPPPPPPAPDPAMPPVPPAAPSPAPMPNPQPLDQMTPPMQPTAAPAPTEMPAPDPTPAVPPPPMPTPMPVPDAPVPPPAEPMQPPGQPEQPPVADSSQVGYVPPANPTPAPLMTGNNMSNSKVGLFGKLRVLIIVVVGLVILSGGGLLLKDTLFTGSSIKVSDLVDDSAEGVSFKRPANWTKSSETSFDGAAFTEGGKPTDDADQGIMVGGASIGVSYDSLSSAQKDMLFEEFKKQFSDGSLFEDSSCKEVGSVTVTKTQQSNYSDTIRLEATCNKFTNRNIKATFKANVGLKDRDMHMLMIVAIDETWDKSGEALNEILNTFKPAN